MLTVSLGDFQQWPTGHFVLDGGNGADGAVLRGQASDVALDVALKGGQLTATSGDGLFSVAGVRLESMTIAGGTGDDTIEGGAGDDGLSGYLGDNRIRGGDGDDRLGGNGVLTGGAGDDLLSRSSDGESTPGIDTLNGGAGFDTYYVRWDVSWGDQVVVTDLSGADLSAASTSFTLGPATDFLTGIEGIYVVSGEGSDSVIGSNGSDTFDASWGADTVRGGMGDDIFLGIPAE